MRDDRKHLKWLSLMIVLTLLISTSILSQDAPVGEATEEPVAEVTEIVEEPVVTDEPVIIPEATEEVVVTDEPIIIPEATEEVVVTEEIIVIPEATEEVDVVVTDEPTPDPTEEIIIIPTAEPTEAVAIPPMPGGRESPLRVMVPQTSGGAQAMSMQALIERNQFPSLIPELSFNPGPKMNLPLNGPASPFKMLAVLVDFSDNTSSVTATSFDSLVFGASNSVADYYDEVSYGQLDIVTVNAPSSLGWIRAPQTYSYYVNGQNCTGGYPNNCQKLAEDLAAAIDSVVDFSQYDNDNNGWVDTFMIIHAGSGAEFGTPNAIWSHSWWTKNYPLVDGKYVGSYIIQPEFWSSPGDMTIGVYSHELAHAFGLPDFYDVDYSSRGIGNWGLMGGGSWNGTLGDSPAHLSAFSRVFLDFITPVNITGASPQTYSLPNVEQNSPHLNATDSIYRWDTGVAGEYFLIENRQQLGYDAGLTASGMLIWHVDENVSGSNKYECNNVNNWNCTQHFVLALEQADGNFNLENNILADAGDPFPGTSNNTSFGFTTTPNSSSYYSSTDHGMLITSISNSQSTMTFNAGINLPDAPNLISPTHTQTVYTQTPTYVWTEVSDATWYNLRVKQNNVEIINQWYEGTAVCSGTCSATPATTLNSGTYTWEIQTYGDVGYGDTTSPATFYVPTPAVVTLSTPDGTTDVEKPTYEWSEDDAAQWYHLYVVGPSGAVVDQWYEAGPLGCSGTCLATPNVALSHGVSYDWYVETWGYGTFGGWSLKKSFTVNLASVGIPTLVAPANAATLYTQTPTFEWDEVGNATWYNLYVERNDNPGVAVVNQWFEGTSTCVGGNCAVVSPVALTSGDHTWKMRAYNGASPSGGNWSGSRTLTIPTPSVPTLIAPVGGFTTDNPTFEWDNDPNAQWYRLTVIGPGGVAVDKWYDASTLGCAATCALVANVPLVQNWEYSWYMQAWGYGYLTDWTDLVNPPKFTVKVDVPAKPSLVSPSSTVTLYEDTPTYVWSDVATATWYNLDVLKNGVPIVDIWYQDANICDGSTCSIDPGVVLSSGDYTWRVHAYNVGGEGLDSDTWSFTIPTPVKPSLVSPIGTAYWNNLTYWWDGDGYSNWYYLYVVDSGNTPVISEWFYYPSGCTNCSAFPDVVLTQGETYTWMVDAWAFGGYAGWSHTSEEFTVNVPAPSAPTLIAPTHTSTEVQNNSITYQWSDVAYATWYNLVVTDSTGTYVYHNNWYNWETNCESKVCTVNDPQNLPNGDYKWKVRSWGPGSTLSETWSSEYTFTVNITPPVAPTQIAPWGVIEDSTPTFSWEHQANSLWYWVDFQDSNDVIFGGQWYYAPNVCNATTCTIPSPVNFSNGTYIWWIQSYNYAGLSSAWTTFPFSVAVDGFYQDFEHWYQGGQWWDETGWYDPHNPSVIYNPDSWYQDYGWAYTPGAASTWKTMGFDQSNYFDYGYSTIDYSDFYYEAMLWRYGCIYCANSLFIRGNIEPIEGNGRWDTTYVLSYNRIGYFSIFTHDQSGAEAVVQPWTYSSAIAQGSAWNRVGVWADGGWLYFYINGTLVAAIYDDTYSLGSAGFGFWSPDVADNYLYVDYAVLYDYSVAPAPERQTELSAEQAQLNQNARRFASSPGSAAMREVDSAGQRGVTLSQSHPPQGPSKSSSSADRSILEMHARPD